MAANDLVSAIGLVCIGMSFGYTSNGGKDDEAQCFEVFTRAADNGITFWDTSDMYRPFTNAISLRLCVTSVFTGECACHARASASRGAACVFLHPGISLMLDRGFMTRRTI